MPRDWFRHIPIRSKRRTKRIIQRARDAHEQKYGEYDITKEKPPPLPVKRSRLKDAYRGKWIRYGEKDLKLYELGDIAHFYKVSRRTVARWYYDGFLPEPFLEKKQGNGYHVFYTIGQCWAICRVLNDIFEQGVKILDMRRLEAHKEMLDEGAERALERLHKTPKNDNKYGVEWE